MPMIQQSRGSYWPGALGLFALGVLVGAALLFAGKVRLDGRYAVAFYHDSGCPEVGIMSAYSLGVLDTRTGAVAVRCWKLSTSITGVQETTNTLLWPVVPDPLLRPWN